MTTYLNNRSAHQLRRFKDGTGACSCDHWMLWGASESNLIKNHQLHIAVAEDSSEHHEGEA